MITTLEQLNATLDAAEREGWSRTFRLFEPHASFREYSITQNPKNKVWRLWIQCSGRRTCIKLAPWVVDAIRREAERPRRNCAACDGDGWLGKCPRCGTSAGPLQPVPAAGPWKPFPCDGTPPHPSPCLVRLSEPICSAFGATDVVVAVWYDMHGWLDMGGKHIRGVTHFAELNAP